MVMACEMGMVSGLALVPGRMTVKKVIAAKAIIRYMIMLRFQLIFMGKLLSIAHTSITQACFETGKSVLSLPVSSMTYAARLPGALS